MKKLIQLLSFFAIAGLLLTACKKKDDEKESKNETRENYLQIDEQRYPLSGGYLMNFGTSPDHDGYNIDLTLYSDGLELITNFEDDEWWYSLNGNGHFIYFEMFSENQNDLSDGTYNQYERDYEDEDDKYPTNTFSYGEVTTNIDWDIDADTYEDGTWLETKDGSVAVSKSGNNYSIRINCEGPEGENITGY